MKGKTRTSWIVWLGLGLLAASLGCPEGQPPAQEQRSTPAVPEPDREPASPPAATGDAGAAEIEAILARADRVDGTADHVVSLCPGCSLAMDGSADHALEAGDYSLHFCSDRCREGFADDLEGALLSLHVPEP